MCGRKYLRRRIHKVKLEQILHPERLEQQHGVRQVRALDLGDRVLEQLVPVRHLRVQAVAEAAARAPRPPRALVRVRLADGRDLQRVHADLGVVHLQLRVPGVHDVQDAVDCRGPASAHLDTTKRAAEGLPVSDVSAMFVATMTLRRPSLVGSKIFACRSAGICE